MKQWPQTEIENGRIKNWPCDLSTRRADTEYQIHAERMIGYAIKAVEELPADQLVTDAIVLLQQAQCKIADYMEKPFTDAHG